MTCHQTASSTSASAVTAEATGQKTQLCTRDTSLAVSSASVREETPSRAVDSLMLLPPAASRLSRKSQLNVYRLSSEYCLSSYTESTLEIVHLDLTSGLFVGNFQLHLEHSVISQYQRAHPICRNLPAFDDVVIMKGLEAKSSIVVSCF